MGSRSRILPGIERGAQAGIEPATGAWVTQRIGSAASGTDHVHTVALKSGNAAYATRCDPLGESGQPCDQGVSMRVTLRVTSIRTMDPWNGLRTHFTE
jgi:hypothetical protein